LGEDAFTLVGLAELRNDTGVGYSGARVDLIAGQVYTPAGAGMVPGVRALASSMAPEAGPSRAYEYHRYSLPQAVDLPPGTVLVPYLVTFVNSDSPLPAGEVTVYDEGGSLLIGSASIGHTPVGEEVALTIGAAFDLTGERTQVSHVRLVEDLYRDTYRIVIRSAKDEPVVVEDWESFSGSWQITHSSLPFEQVDAHTVKFLLEVPAGGEAELTYTVEWRY